MNKTMWLLITALVMVSFHCASSSSSSSGRSSSGPIFQFEPDDQQMDDVHVNSDGPQQSPKPTQFKGHFGKIYANSYKNGQVATASQDGKVIVWNATTSDKITAIPLRSSWVMTVDLDEKAERVCAGGLDNLASIYYLNDPEINDGVLSANKELAAHDGYVSTCRFLDGVNENQLLTASGDSTVILWDIENQATLKIIPWANGDVMSVAFSPFNDGKGKDALIAFGSCDSMVYITTYQHVAKSENDNVMFPLVKIHGAESDINSVDFSPNGRWLAAAGDDSVARIYDLSNLNKDYSTLPKPINAQEMLENARHSGSAEMDRVKEKIQQIEMTRNGGGIILAAELSDDSILCGITSVKWVNDNLLFMGYDDYNIQYAFRNKKGKWSFGKLDMKLKHENRVSALTADSENGILFSGSWDTTQIGWDVKAVKYFSTK